MGAQLAIPIPQEIVNRPGPLGNEPGTLYAGPKPNLFAGVQPTLMEEWELTAINWPCLSLVTLSAASTIPPEVLATARLLYGGDVMWEQQRQVALGALNAGATWLGANVAFADSLVNPISIRRGRTLTLELEAAFTASGAKVEAVLLAGSTQLLRRLVEPNIETGIRQGQLLYEAHVLSGHTSL